MKEASCHISSILKYLHEINLVPTNCHWGVTLLLGCLFTGVIWKKATIRKDVCILVLCLTLCLLMTMTTIKDCDRWIWNFDIYHMIKYISKWRREFYWIGARGVDLFVGLHVCVYEVDARGGGHEYQFLLLLLIWNQYTVGNRKIETG